MENKSEDYCRTLAKQSMQVRGAMEQITLLDGETETKPAAKEDTPTSPPKCPQTRCSESEEDLLKDFTNGCNFYDLRMLRNCEDSAWGVDSLSLLEDILNHKEDCGCGRLIHSRAYHVIDRLANEFGYSEEKIKDIIRTNQKKGIKKYEDSLLHDLENFYKKCVGDAVENGDAEYLSTWIEHAETSYRDYLRYPKFFGKQPMPMPDYIVLARGKYKELIQDKKELLKI